MIVHGCPDATILAAFAEGSLPPEQRVEVERHMSDCSECPAVIGEVIRFLAESSDEDRERASPHHHRRWFVAAAIAAICIPVAVLRFSLHDPLSRIVRIAATSRERAYEGRLDGFPHAHFRSPRSGEATSVPIALLAEANRLANLGPDADVLHARGVAALLSGKPRQAVRLLSAATRSAPAHAATWNDLAVAELVRASLDDPDAITSALDAADHATALAYSAPAAHFNRGIILEHLGRDAEASAAYRQALAQETSDAWRREIRERMQRLANDR